MQLQLLKLRYAKVFEGLIDNPIIKFVLSLLCSLWLATKELVQIEPILLVPVILAILFDYYTGIRASKDKGIRITSFGLRQLAPKIIEYAIFITLFTVAAYSFGRLDGDGWVISFLSPLRNIHYLAYFWVFWTEVTSVYENVGGDSSRYQELWEIVKGKIFKEE